MRETIRPTRLQREIRARKPIPEEPKSKLERYLKYAPLAYLYLIVYSYVGLDTYYSEFGVEILGFMSVQEMLVLPLENVSGVLITIGWLLIYISALILIIYMSSRLILAYVLKRKSPGFKKTKLSIKKIFFDGGLYSDFVNYLTIVLTLSAPYSVFELRESGILQALLVIYVKFVIAGMATVILMAIWILINNQSSYRFDKLYLKRTTVFRLTFILCLLVYINYLNMLNRAVEFVKEKDNQVKIELKGQEKTNTHALLLGTTNSSIFLLDTAARETFVIPKSEIRELRYLKDIQIEGLKPDSIPADTLQQVEADTLKLPTHS